MAEARPDRLPLSAKSRRVVLRQLGLFLGMGLCTAPVLRAEQAISLETQPTAIRISIGHQTFTFKAANSAWALDCIQAGRKAVARPFSRMDSFFIGGGEASRFTVLTNTPDVKSVQFEVGSNAVVTYTVNRAEQLPLMHVKVEGPDTATCAFQTVTAGAAEHGAWVTRGIVATDADGLEDFIDANGPMVFGHSTVGAADTAYVFMPKTALRSGRDGRTERRTDIWFKSSRPEIGSGRYAGAWQLRMGRYEAKEFAVVFDCDLGGRFSSVCEKYFAPAVNTLVDIATLPRNNYDPDKCIEMMPIRHAAPDIFIPGYGWTQAEGNSGYPSGSDSAWQAAALLAFEGLATGREWERNFGGYIMDQTPLVGPENTAFLVRRPGGVTRWAYGSNYRDGFHELDGGTWWTADMLYRLANVLHDPKIRQTALDAVRHDLNVKLDLAKMTYPPVWSPVSRSASTNHSPWPGAPVGIRDPTSPNGTVSTNHRDDWFKTPGLAYCAYMAATVAYPETGDKTYLKKADRICEWFAGYMTPESKLNQLQDNNMYATFSYYLTLAFLNKYDRSHDRRFLDLARDCAWVQIMTTCTTAGTDNLGNPLAGTTCVGVRGCVDYDCAPNLCQEKDLNFDGFIGPLLDHVNGPAYAKYLALVRLVLNKDSWNSAWTMELRDTNLRTMYDTYARGMANLIYGLDQSTNCYVVAVDKLVSETDTNIVHRRAIVLANGTTQKRDTRLLVRYLQPGDYNLRISGSKAGRKNEQELAAGIPVSVPADSEVEVQVEARVLRPPPDMPVRNYDNSITYLSDLEPFAAQRGVGLPVPTYVKDQSFGGQPIDVGGQRSVSKGLGCLANTVIVYDLKSQYQRFQALVGVDQEMAGLTNPPPSVFFTAHVDGVLKFESGGMFKNTPPRAVDLDVRNAQKLMLRMSCNWDNNGVSRNDHGDWADAKLIGKAMP